MCYDEIENYHCGGNMERTDKILVIVDMQNDFIDGSLGSAEAKNIVDRVAEKIRKRKSEGYRVLVTMDTHGEDYLSTQEGTRLPVKHCIKGTYGWRLNAKIAAETADDKIYEKNAFAGRGLIRDLEELQPRVVEFVGLCTDICVVSNALGAKAVLPEAQIVVDASCCAGGTPESHAAALITMKSCQIDVTEGTYAER